MFNDPLRGGMFAHLFSHLTLEKLGGHKLFGKACHLSSHNHFCWNIGITIILDWDQFIPT